MRCRIRRLASAAVVAGSVAVSGCGFGVGDIELQGGVFDALGVGTNSKQTTRNDVKLKPRAPLVLPPGVDRLPSPGTSMAAANPELLTIQDPDQVQEVDHAALEKAQQEYCDKNYSEHRHGSEFVNGPLGPCRKSVMTAVKKWTSGEE